MPVASIKNVTEIDGGKVGHKVDSLRRDPRVCFADIENLRPTFNVPEGAFNTFNVYSQPRTA